MENLKLPKRRKTKAEKDFYYGKLEEIADILIDTDEEITIKVSELLRGENVDRSKFNYRTHKSYISKYLFQRTFKKSDAETFYKHLISLGRFVSKTQNEVVRHIDD